MIYQLVLQIFGGITSIMKEIIDDDERLLAGGRLRMREAAPT